MQSASYLQSASMHSFGFTGVPIVTALNVGSGSCTFSFRKHCSWNRDEMHGRTIPKVRGFLPHKMDTANIKVYARWKCMHTYTWRINWRKLIHNSPRDQFADVNLWNFVAPLFGIEVGKERFFLPNSYLKSYQYFRAISGMFVFAQALLITGGIFCMSCIIHYEVQGKGFRWIGIRLERPSWGAQTQYIFGIIGMLCWTPENSLSLNKGCTRFR